MRIAWFSHHYCPDLETGLLNGYPLRTPTWEDDTGSDSETFSGFVEKKVLGTVTRVGRSKRGMRRGLKWRLEKSEAILHGYLWLHLV